MQIKFIFFCFFMSLSLQQFADFVGGHQADHIDNIIEHVNPWIVVGKHYLDTVSDLNQIHGLHYAAHIDNRSAVLLAVRDKIVQEHGVEYLQGWTDGAIRNAARFVYNQLHVSVDHHEE